MFASFENVPAAGAPGLRPRPRARVRRRRTPVVAWVVRIAVAGVAGLVPAWAPATEAGAAAADAIAFDVDMMKARGIDPRVADYFMRQARFMPGMSLVTLTVNGQRKGGAMVRFDEKGQLCMDARFLARAGLRVPPAPGAGRAGALARQTEKRAQTSGALGEIGHPPTGETSTATPAGDAMQPAGCIDYRAVYPQTIVTLKPNSAMVDLLVPTDALVPDAPAQPEYATGGVAGLLNYDLLAVGNSFAGGSSRYYSASGEFGFNAGDWIVRSRSMYSSDGAASNVSHLYLYGQRTFVPQEAVFQGGEINVGNSIFAGPAIYGVQWMPELALKRAVSPGTAVEGIAQTQARIEVRQAGALIFSTVVPPGPFALANIPLLNGSNDLDVTVIEANGAARRFLIPAAQLGAGTLGVTPGYAIAAGKLRQLGDDPRVKPWLVTATGTWEAGRRAAVTGGVLIGTQYQSVAGGLDARLGGTTSASMRAILSNAARESLRGAQFMGSVSTQLLPALAANFTMTQQTPGYRSITDTTEDTTVDWIGGHYRGQYTAGVAWGHPVLGAFSANYNWSSLFTGVGTRRLTASWGRTFRLATVSLNVEKGVGGRASGNGNSVYLSVSVPLGKRSLRTYVNRVDGSTRLGATYSEQVSDLLNYSLNADFRPEDGGAAGSANASLTPYYTRLNLGVAQYGASSTSYNAELSGGVLAHAHGVTFSPYAIGDTFGVAALGSGLGGVRLATPHGPAWTDAWGRAVISSAPAYAQSRVEVATRTLPRNVDIGNAHMQIHPGRGSVSYLNFDVMQVRRLLLHARDDAGAPLPRNATVTDQDGNFLTTVLNDGTIFLPNTSITQGLRVTGQDGTACMLAFKVPATQDLDAYFDEVEARCHAGADMPAQDRTGDAP